MASCIQGQVVTQGRPWLVVYRDKLLHRGDRGKLYTGTSCYIGETGDSCIQGQVVT